MEDLRAKWQTVPSGLERRSTAELLKLSDDDVRPVLAALLDFRGEGTEIGWFYDVYKEAFRGKRILEIGSGLGLDGVTFTRYGADWTFSDIVQSNLDFVRRHLSLAGLDQKNANFFLIDSLTAFDQLEGHYDFIWANGSLINLPFDDARKESMSILRHLKVGGRWIELTYPKKRWMREGSPPFSEWGEMTDGPGTPWMEWYSVDRLKERLFPAPMRTIFTCDFCSDAFNWHDIQLTGAFDANLDRIAFLAPLSAFNIHGNANAEFDGSSLHITTPDQIWSYAVHLDLSSGSKTKVVFIDYDVKQGSIGLGLIDSALQFVGSEAMVDQGSGTIKLELPEAAVVDLMIRNTSGNGQSMAHISQIRVFD